MVDKYVVRSTEPDVEIPRCSVGELLKKWIENVDLNKVMMIDAATDRRQTYAELHQTGLELGTALLDFGIESTDRAMFLATNSVDYFDLYIALCYLGTPFSPSTPVNGPYEIQRQLNDLQAKVLIVSANKLSVIKQMLGSEDREQSETISGLKLLIVLECDEQTNQIFESLEKHSNRPKLVRTFNQVLSAGHSRPLARVPHFTVENPATDPFAIVYTSGTTGLPKGAILSHRSFISTMLSLCNMHIFRECQTVASLYPLGHVTGTLFMPVYMHYQNTAVMYPPGKIGPLLLKSIEKYQINVLPLIQMLAQDLYQNRDRYPVMLDLSSLRWMAYGGNKVGDETVIKALIQTYRVRIDEFYGATELMVGVANYGPEQNPYGCAGNLVANAEMKIVDLKSYGQSLPANQLGEIWIRSPNCFVGYLNKPEATEETIDKDGWYHSGDVGYYDEQGRLFFTERLKELIKYKGWSIGPAEIENFINSHPAVDGVCIVGVPHQTEGSHLRAYVKLHEGKSATELELVNYVKENMGYQKRLNNGVRFVEEIPRTAIGKVDRKYFKSLVKDEELLTESAEPEKD